MTNRLDGLLLDTSVVIAPPRGGLPEASQGNAISVITIAELEYGVTSTTDLLEQQKRRRRVRRVTATFDVLGFDPITAELYGALAGMVRNAGRNPRPRRLDLLIAATAVHHRLALATRNPDDFRHLDCALTVIPITD